MRAKSNKKIRKSIYCFFMRKIWKVAYRVYNWAEDRRPAGGFKVENV